MEKGDGCWAIENQHKINASNHKQQKKQLDLGKP